MFYMLIFVYLEVYCCKLVYLFLETDGYVKIIFCCNWHFAQDAVDRAYIQCSHNHGKPGNIRGAFENIHFHPWQIHRKVIVLKFTEMSFVYGLSGS